MRKRREEHSGQERWLVSYADFITLLFAFFVVMYAISARDAAKLKAAAESVRRAFGEAPGAGPANGATGRARGQGQGQDELAPVGVGGPSQVSELRQLQELIEENLALELGATDFADKVQLRMEPRGLLVRVSAKDLYGVGEVEARAELRPILDRIGRVLARSGRPLRIEGHTDAAEDGRPASGGKSVAGGGGRGASGGQSAVGGGGRGGLKEWELSAGRAAWLARYWEVRFGLDPALVAVTGYGHHRPLSEGGSEWARAGNRRVEVWVQ